MNILWDLRLFSHGYATRGVGEWTARTAAAVCKESSDHCFFIWGDHRAVPVECVPENATFIPYCSGSWKKSLWQIPLLIKKYRIDIFHYWMTLGPIHALGMGLFHNARTIATVYDLAIVHWHDIPATRALEKSWYWRIQKRLFASIDTIIGISRSTSNEIGQTFPALDAPRKTIYTPLLPPTQTPPVPRQNFLVALGGSPHKNLRRVIAAFEIARQTIADCQLIVLGVVDKDSEVPLVLPNGIRFEPMENYHTALLTGGGLVVASTHEGLGLPVLDAMAYATPLVVSTIPVFKEICDGHAVFVDPLDEQSIAAGMIKIIGEQNHWTEQSAIGAIAYRRRSQRCGREVLETYYTPDKVKKGPITHLTFPMIPGFNRKINDTTIIQFYRHG